MNIYSKIVLKGMARTHVLHFDSINFKMDLNNIMMTYSSINCVSNSRQASVVRNQRDLMMTMHVVSPSVKYMQLDFPRSS